MLTFIIIETVADNQLFRFHQEKKNVLTSGKHYTRSLSKGFMTEGLWKYVRHPNFAPEQAIWISFYFFGVSASGQWLNFTLAGPLLLVMLFIRRVCQNSCPGSLNFNLFSERQILNCDIKI